MYFIEKIIFLQTIYDVTSKYTQTPRFKNKSSFAMRIIDLYTLTRN